MNPVIKAKVVMALITLRLHDLLQELHNAVILGHRIQSQGLYGNMIKPLRQALDYFLLILPA